MRVIVGLGNPGPEYEWSRHNIGFLVLDALSEQHGLGWKRSRFHRGFLAQGQIAGQSCRLLKPATFMNHSGQAVVTLLGQRGTELQDILVVCDDFNLTFGQLRIRPAGSHGGHNGLESVIRHVKSKDFPRLRVGIGAPPARRDPADFVLSPFRPDEKKDLGDICDAAGACCVAWLKEGTGTAMNRFNTRKKEKEHE